MILNNYGKSVCIFWWVFVFLFIGKYENIVLNRDMIIKKFDVNFFFLGNIFEILELV